MSRAVAVRSNAASGRRLPAVDESPKGLYAPGAVRAATDEEFGRVKKFCGEHPEYERALGYEGLKQVAATYRDDDDLRVSGELRAAGVREGWRRVETDDVNPLWSDEQ